MHESAEITYLRSSYYKEKNPLTFIMQNYVSKGKK